MFALVPSIAYFSLFSHSFCPALTDMYCEHVRDIKDAYQKVRGITEEAAKATAMEKWFATDLPEVMIFVSFLYRHLI